MHLEMIRFGTQSARPPLLFVHGSFCGAWVWNEHALPYFAQAGWHGAAVSLTGHGSSGGHQRLHSLGLADYVANIAAAIRILKRPPIVIGHSMGGLLVQLFARDHVLPGMVLMGSVPPSGLSAPYQHMLLHHRDMLMQIFIMQTAGPRWVNRRLVYQTLFSKATPDDRATALLGRFQRESQRAAIESLTPQLFKPPSQLPPTLVVGGELDCFISKDQLRATADFWQADLEITPGGPHLQMLDATWEMPLSQVKAWLDRNFTPPDAH
jgi:pimeloyl-ACP methyl ester carboxylesterase